MTVAGVLDSDNYVLYPFENTSMKIGFSKYGEMIDTNTNVGLEYGDVDPFAAPSGLSVIESLPKNYWSQGWLLNITYARKGTGQRNVWAMATFADMVDYGGPWLRVNWGTNNYDDGPTKGEPGLYGFETPDDPGYPIGGAAVLMNGGRKTNGTAVTEPIKVLYDGPRRFVALLNTTIYDYTGTPPDEPLVRLLITIVFDKVKKEVILFKDVKSVISFKILTGFMNVQLSNRGQVDLGTETEGFESFAHFYTEGIGIYDVSVEGQSTVYDSEYAMVTTETPCKIYNDTATVNTNSSCLYDTSKTWPVSDLTGYKVAILHGTGAGQVRTIVRNTTTWLVVTPVWTTTPTIGSQYAIYDPAICKTADGRWPQTSATNATYDLLQAVNPDAEYVWSAAFWPSLSDWTTWGWNQQFRSMRALDPHYIDMPLEEEVPYYIGEWDFELGHSTSANRMFRGVTAYSVVDQHDADDADIGALHINYIDSEIQYLMAETFNPYDLYSAVEKDSSRWVEFFTGDGSTKEWTLQNTLGLYVTGGRGEDGLPSAEWISSSELPWRSCQKAFKLTLDATDAGEGALIAFPVNLTLSEITEFIYHYWVPDNPQAPWGPHVCFYTQSASDPTKHGDYTLFQTPVPTTPTEQWLEFDAVANTTGDAIWFWYGNDPDVVPEVVGPGNLKTLAAWQALAPDAIVKWVTVEFGMWSTINADYYVYVDDITFNGEQLSPKRGELIYEDGAWDQYCSFAERVLVDGVLQERDVDYTIDYMTGSFWDDYHQYLTVVTTPHAAYPRIVFTTAPDEDAEIKVLYSTEHEGSYEWIVVGKDAATIDAIGAAYMTEAFDSIKHTHVQVTGLDINETAAHGAYAPFVMGRAATGTKADYRDCLGRTFLRDDWCTTYPVSSSNMLFSGGPGANLGAEYFNEFTNAFWARPEYVVNNTGQASKILALSCWNRTTYGAGYAVISVYKDLNGTIGFLIWGITGQDTYYATQWFWETGIVYLQTVNRGVTDIVLKIKYPTLDPTHPIVSIKERLGTISEKTPHDP
jgi:hypothetical protein